MVTRTTGPWNAGLGPLDAVALMVGLSSLGLVLLIRQRLPSCPSTQAQERWWREQLGRAVLIWCLWEFPAVIGAITLLVTRHLPAYGALGTLALGGLVASRPSRLCTAD